MNKTDLGIMPTREEIENQFNEQAKLEVEETLRQELVEATAPVLEL